MIDTIMKRVEKTPGGCWEWRGAKNSDGYGVIYISKVGQRKVHRQMFEEVHGLTPEVVMHTCDNPLCCNPEHLLNGTHQMNRRDKNCGSHFRDAPKKSHCKNGHPLGGDNLKITVEKGYEKRRCKACARDRKAKYMATENGRKKHNEGQLRRYHARQKCK